MRYIIAILFIGILISLNACLEAVDIKTTEEKKFLVFEGFISTQPGPHIFKLSKSAKYGSIFEGFSKKEENASIFIKDDLGNQVFLDELTPGRYQTPEGYQAEVGRTYTLVINSKGGQYISAPEKLLPVPQIKRIDAKFKKFPSVNPLLFRSGVELYTTFDDPSEEQNFMFWNTNGTYILYTNPELHTIKDGLGNPISAPKDCCDRCFLEEQKADATFYIYDDNQSNGNENTVLAGYLPDDGGRFDEKYLVRLEQFSLSREAFQFYDLLNEQLSIDGDIFDPPPAGTNGNIINVSDPTQRVIGYFHASDIYVDSIYIENSLIETPNKNRQLYDDCRVFGGVVDPPSYWQ
jgi:hypothetical protein